jgi:hypothetical protein
MMTDHDRQNARIPLGSEGSVTAYQKGRHGVGTVGRPLVGPGCRLPKRRTVEPLNTQARWVRTRDVHWATAHRQSEASRSEALVAPSSCDAAMMTGPPAGATKCAAVPVSRSVLPFIHVAHLAELLARDSSKGSVLGVTAR